MMVLNLWRKVYPFILFKHNWIDTCTQWNIAYSSCARLWLCVCEWVCALQRVLFALFVSAFYPIPKRNYRFSSYTKLNNLFIATNNLLFFFSSFGILSLPHDTYTHTHRSAMPHRRRNNNINQNRTKTIFGVEIVSPFIIISFVFSSHFYMLLFYFVHHTHAMEILSRPFSVRVQIFMKEKKIKFV